VTIIPQRHRRTPFCSNTALCIALRDKKLRLNAVAYFVCESCRQLYSESSKNFFCLQFIAVLFTVLFITAIKETTGLTDLPSLIADRRHSLFIHICRLSRLYTWWLSHKHYVYPLMPSPAHLPLTGSAHRAVHGELGFNRWKIWVYPSVPANSQPWTARCGDRYDPQSVERNSE